MYAGYVKSENYWFQVCGIPGIGGNHHVNFLFIEGIICEFPVLEGIVFAELPVLVVVVYAWSDVVHNEVCSGSMWNQLQISCFTGSHVCGTTSFSGSRRCMIRRSTQWGVLRIDVESVANFLFLEEIVFTEHVRFSYSGLIEEIFELPKLID